MNLESLEQPAANKHQGTLANTNRTSLEKMKTFGRRLEDGFGHQELQVVQLIELRQAWPCRPRPWRRACGTWTLGVVGVVVSDAKNLETTNDNSLTTLQTL
jgi:hypothetical protein